MIGLEVLAILAGVLAGLGVFLFCFGVPRSSNGALCAGAGCLAGFVTCTLGWVATLVQGR